MARLAGVKFLGIAEITGYSPDGVPTYSEVTELKQFENFSGTINSTDSAWYSNDTVEESYAEITGAELEITVGSLSTAIRSRIAGSLLDSSNVLVVKADDLQREFAVVAVFTMLGKNGGEQTHVFHRCKLSANDIEAETKTDSVTAASITITGAAVPSPDGRVLTIYDGRYTGI